MENEPPYAGQAIERAGHQVQGENAHYGDKPPGMEQIEKTCGSKQLVG